MRTTASKTRARPADLHKSGQRQLGHGLERRDGHGPALIDEQAGTITFVTSYAGLPEKIQTAHGAVLLRDAGIISFADTFDLATGEFLGSEVTIKGPHPEADSDFVLFCEVITAALT